MTDLGTPNSLDDSLESGLLGIKHSVWYFYIRLVNKTYYILPMFTLSIIGIHAKKGKSLVIKKSFSELIIKRVGSPQVSHELGG